MKKLVLILPVLVLLLSGCVTMGPTNGPNMGSITLQFVDGDTGEPLSKGYMFTSETWTSVPRWIGSLGFKDTRYGKHRVFEIDKEGKLTLPAVGYRRMKGGVFVKNYERAGFSLHRSSYLSNLEFHLTLQKSKLPERYKAEEEYGRSITVDKKHYKIPLKDITSDSEGWYRKLKNLSGAAGKRLTSDAKKKEIKRYLQEELKQFFNKYSYDPWNFKRHYLEAQWKKSFRKRHLKKKESKPLNKTLKQQQNVKVAIIDSARESKGYIVDPYGHGLFTAQTINKIAPDICLEFYKTLNGLGRGKTDDLTESISKAIEADVDIINIGLGFYHVDSGVKKAISKAINKNIVVVSSGSNASIDQPFYPADYPGVIKGTAENIDKILENLGNEKLLTTINSFVVNNNSEATAIISGFIAKTLKKENNSNNTISLPESKSKTKVKQNKKSEILFPQWGVETHRAITEAAARNSLDATSYQEIVKFGDETPAGYLDSVSQGSKDEDGGANRFFNHFWQKEQDSELSVFSGMVISDAFRWGLEHWANDYRWEDAIQRYGYTKDTRRQSYYTLGFVTHLVQDMHVPEHVHDDPHFPAGDPTTLEDYVGGKYEADDIIALADGTIADISSPAEFFAEGNEFGYKQNLFDPEPNLSKTDGAVRNNAFGIGEYTVKTRTGGVTPPSSSPYEWGVYQLFWDGKFVGDFQFAEDGHDKTYRRELSGWVWLPPQWFTAEDEFWDVGLEAGGDSLKQKYYIESSSAAGLDDEAVKPYTTPLLKRAVKNSAGFLKLFHDLVNTPPYLKELQIYSGGGEELYDGLLVKHMKTANTDIMPLIRVESRELSHLTEKKLYRLPGSDPLEVSLHFNEPVMKPTSTIDANEKLTGKEVTLVDKKDPEHTLILADNSGVEGEELEPFMERKTWEGKLLLPDPSVNVLEAAKAEGNYFIEVRAKDRHYHRSESGEMLEGLDLDPDPTTPALRKIGGGDLLDGSEKYVWSGYEEGEDVRKDKNHEITIDSLRPAIKSLRIEQGEEIKYEEEWTESAGNLVRNINEVSDLSHPENIIDGVDGSTVRVYVEFTEPVGDGVIVKCCG